MMSKIVLKIFCFMLLLQSCDLQRKSNTISIEVIGAKQPDSLQLLNYNNSEAITLKNEGKAFVFPQKNTVDDAFKLNVYTNGKTFSKKVFLNGENVTIKVELNTEGFKIDTVFNSDIYYKQIHFYSSLDSLKQVKASDSVINTVVLKQIKNSIDHPLSFELSDYYISKNKNYKLKLERLKSVLEVQPDHLKTHALSVHRELNELLFTENLNFSDFEFLDKSGKVSKVDLSHDGDYLVDFWFVQCPPCVRDHKKIVTYLEKLDNNNTELIGISIDTVEDKWLNYLVNNNYNWQNYRELHNGNDLVDAMDVWDFPTYILIDNSGDVKTKFYSFEDIVGYFDHL